MPKVLIHINQVVRVISNDGGYLGAQCISCGQLGYLNGHYGYAHNAKDVMSNRLKHKKTCVMNKYSLKAFKAD